MSQSDMGNMESPLSGSDFINGKLEPWATAVKSNHSGTSRPSYAVAQMIWVDTTTTPWIIKMYDGSNDISLGTVNATSDIYTVAGLGSIVQAYNANLAAEAGLTGAADKISYYTGAGAKAVTDFTSAARTLLAATTAALQRTALGLGAVALLSTVDYNTIDSGALPRGFVNKFRNGGMNLFGYGPGSRTLTAGTPAYMLDGWILSCTGANLAIAQTTEGVNTANSVQVFGTVGCTNFKMYQRIESFLASELYYGGYTAGSGAAPVTVQFRVQNNTGSTISPTLTVKHANAKDNFGAMTTDVNAVALSTIAQGQIKTIAYTFTPISGTANGLEVTLDFGTGLNAAERIWITSADIRVTVGLPTGQICLTPPHPEQRHIADELILAARYFRKSFPYNGTLSQNSGTRTGAEAAYSNGTANGLALYRQVTFDAPMRATPTITTYNPNAANANWRNQTAGADLAITVSQACDRGFILANGATAITQNLYEAHWSASAEL